VGTLTVNDDSYPRVRLRRVYLRHALFEDGGDGARLNGYDYLVDLTVGRRSALELTVELTVASPEEAPVRLSVCYGADFVLPETTSEADRDEVLRETAYELAPVVLYTYIRQMVEDLSGRGRGERITLPFLPVPLAVGEEEQRVPQPVPKS
jgi:preprotein translocase subunit SecB